MKNMKMYLFALLLLLIAVASCSVSDPTKARRWVMIGEGGGITGAYTHFWLLPNGKIYRREQTDSLYIHMNAMPGRVARRYFRELPDVFAGSSDKPLPDNIYKSIIWQTKEQQKTFTWLYPNQNNEKAEDFYNYLLREMYEYNPTATR
jgi:hypothetical protein